MFLAMKLYLSHECSATLVEIQVELYRENDVIYLPSLYFPFFLSRGDVDINEDGRVLPLVEFYRKNDIFHLSSLYFFFK
jgi:hypothetical protein